MVIESDLQKSDQDDSKTELFVNTSAFTNEDFKTYLNICEKIQYNEQLRRSTGQRRSPCKIMTASMTREEIFECSTLDEDGFLNALEHQNSYVPPPLHDFNLSQSMTNALQYFDEDVVVDSGSSTSHTPVKQHSKVTAVLANFKGRKGNSTPSPPTRRHKWNPSTKISSKIQELKKQYELGQPIVSRSPNKLKSPKGLRKSMVKQLAKIFNTKIAETENKTACDTEQKKNTKTRTVRVSYRPQILPSPVHSPRSKRKQGNKTHAMMAEHAFKQWSVKDKATLFNKSSNKDNVQNGEKLSLCQEPKQTKSRRRFARGEVINEKQEPVKQLTQKLEAKSIDQQQTVSMPQKNKKHISTKESNDNEKPVESIKNDQGSEKLSETNQNDGELIKDPNLIERSMDEKALPTEVNVNLMTNAVKENLNLVNRCVLTRRLSNLQAETANSTTSSVEEAVEHEAKSTSLSKLGSDESHIVESFAATFNKALRCGLVKSAKLKRKKRMRRILMWKPELSMVEAKTVQSTDSESEYDLPENTAPVTVLQTMKLFDTTKNFVGKVNIQHYQPIFATLDESLRRTMSSALRMGASHSLSIVFSNHLISAIYDPGISFTSYHEISRSCPSLIETVPKVEMLEFEAELKVASLEVPQPIAQLTQSSSQLSIQLSTQLLTPTSILPSTQPSLQPTKLNQSNVSRKLMDSYVDQGFETGSNELEVTLHSITTNATQKLQKAEATLLTILANELAESSKTNEKYPSCFSTPIKGHLLPQTTDDALEKLDFSPILATPTKSSNETPEKCCTEGLKSVDVDQSLECTKNSTQVSRVKQSVALPKQSTVNVCNSVASEEKASSVFWINTGDFCVSLDIYHNSAERLSLLYDIFSQKSYESRDISFGIDEQIFFAKNSIEWSNIRAHFPSINNCSHYWFASGDMTLPFMGKFLLPEKIKRLFNIVREAVAESGTIHFGVDHYDFSSVHEIMYGKSFINTTAPPMTAPDVMSTSLNSNSIRTSDLDNSSFDSEVSSNFPVSTTPLSNNHSRSISMDSAHFTLPQNGLMSSECPSLDYEEEHSVEQLYEDAIDQSVDNEASSKWISKPLHLLQTQQQKLQAIEQRMHCYANSIDLKPMSNELEAFKNSPNYVCELQEIITAIIDIGKITGFRNCSLHQLESFTYFLSHYADICLDSCLEHMDRILQALKEKRELKV